MRSQFFFLFLELTLVWPITTDDVAKLMIIAADSCKYLPTVRIEETVCGVTDIFLWARLRFHRRRD